MRLLRRDSAHWSSHQSRRRGAGGYRRYFVGSTVKLFQSFALHLQLHMGILFEDLRVTPAEQLGYPFIGYVSGTESWSRST